MSDGLAISWCCPQFKWRFTEADEMGFGIVVEASAGQTAFLLQHRALPLAEEKKATNGALLAYRSQTGIRFCPWCGRELLKFYKLQLGELWRLLQTGDGDRKPA